MSSTKSTVPRYFRTDITAYTQEVATLADHIEPTTTGIILLVRPGCPAFRSAFALGRSLRSVRYQQPRPREDAGR
jgi:hypothetical protein